MISIPRVVLFLVGAVLLLANTSVAQIAPTPAGGVATNATPVPIWWRKYKKDLGVLLKKCKFLRKRVPRTGDSCARLLEGDVCLIGTAFCCSEGCEPAVRCDCKSGAFVCETNTFPNPCPAVDAASSSQKTAPPRGRYTKFPSASPVKK